jgi:hypothetical protein
LTENEVVLNDVAVRHPQLEVLMRKLFGGMVLAAVALTLPALAHAQRRPAAAAGPRHEFGIDLSAAYVSPNADGVDGGISLITPVDVRIGFVPRAGKKMMWEPRLALNFNTVGGETTYLFTPQINMLYSNTTGGHRRGMYFTGGAGLLMGDGGAGSGTAVKLEGGIGWRKPWASAAWRYEVGIQYVSESAELGPFADYIAIGGRVGISLWK